MAPNLGNITQADWLEAIELLGTKVKGIRISNAGSPDSKPYRRCGNAIADTVEYQLHHERQEPKSPSNALPPFDVPMHLDGRRCATVPCSESDYAATGWYSWMRLPSTS
jgi:hypothetical protein